MKTSIADGEIVYLVCVDPEKNNNKVYIIERKGDTLHCQYGRQTERMTHVTYDRSKFRSLYKKKIKHRKTPYTDMSDIYVTETKTKTEIDDDGKEINLVFDKQEIADFIYLIQRNAHDVAQRSLTVSIEDVTETQVDASLQQLALITQIRDQGTLDDINEALTRQFMIIPRYINRLNGVASVMFNGNAKHDDKILEDEFELLDQLQTILEQKQGLVKENVKDVVAELPFEIELSNEQELLDLFYAGLVDQYTDAKVVEIFKIHNEAAANAYSDIGNEKQLWHGSKTANWNSILTNHLKVRPPGIPTTGSMFGNGIYFANRSQKSVGYSSMRGGYWTSGNDDMGIITLYDVALGNADMDDGKSYNSRIETSVRKGYNSLWVHGSANSAGSMIFNDEILIPSGKQCKPSFAFLIRGN